MGQKLLDIVRERMVPIRRAGTMDIMDDVVDGITDGHRIRAVECVHCVHVISFQFRFYLVFAHRSLTSLNLYRRWVQFGPRF